MSIFDKMKKRLVSLGLAATALAGCGNGNTGGAGTADEISGIAIDGNKMILTFAKIAPDALLTFTQFAPLPKKHLEGVDPVTLQQAAFWQSPVGSGPFKVKESR